MHALGVAFDQGRLVDNDLLQAAVGDYPESFTRVGDGRKADRRGLYRRVLLAVKELKAPLRFALECKPGRKGPGQLAGQIEHVRNVTALELKLDLAERYRAAAGINCSPIDRQLNRVLVVGNRIYRPSHPRLEQ